MRNYLATAAYIITYFICWLFVNKYCKAVAEADLKVATKSAVVFA